MTRDDMIRNLACGQYVEEGTLEIDMDAKVSECDAPTNGAYVQAWVFVDFTGTALDKKPASVGNTPCARCGHACHDCPCPKCSLDIMEPGDTMCVECDRDMIDEATATYGGKT